MLRPIAAWLLILLLPLAVRAQGKLQQVRQEVRAEEKQDQEDEAADDDCDATWSCDDSDPVEVNLSGTLFSAFMASLIGNPLGYFLDYPYAQDWPGFMWIGTVDPEHDPPVKSLAVRLSVEESNDFDGVNRVNVLYLVEDSSRLGLQGSWSTLNERLPDGGRDSLVLGDVNLTVRFLETSACQFRWGVGARWLSDAETDWGFNFTFGGDLYPCKPFIVSAQFDVGTLGSADVYHGRGTLGVNWRCFEIFGGYDFLRIGTVDLQGPVVGLRLWF